MAYQNSVKENFLGVSREILLRDGPVSFACAGAMLDGIKRQFDVDIAVSFTAAGPTADEKSAVGDVYVGLDLKGERYLCICNSKGVGK